MVTRVSARDGNNAAVPVALNLGPDVGTIRDISVPLSEQLGIPRAQARTIVRNAVENKSLEAGPDHRIRIPSTKGTTA